ncbi:MAG: hypothetical protein ACQESN_11240 [Thermotogota bacterium]
MTLEINLCNSIAFILMIIAYVIATVKIQDKNKLNQVYFYFNKQMINFVRWGKTATIVQLFQEIEKTNVIILLISIVFAILTAEIRFLHFLTLPMSLIFTISLLSAASFTFIQQPKEHTVKTLNDNKSLIKLCFLISLGLIFYSIVILNTYQHISFYIGIGTFLLTVLYIFLSISIPWIVFGTIPTIILIVLFLLIKSSRVLEKVIHFKQKNTFSLPSLLMSLSTSIALFVKCS